MGTRQGWERADDLVARAASLRPLLERHQATGDRRRRLADETVEELAVAGLFGALVPQRFGGGECDLRTVIDATAEISKADPSAGWVVMILGSGAWITGLFPNAAQQEVYADGPDARVCTVLAPRSTASRVAGGWKISGTWAPASGCRHSHWALLGFPWEQGESGLALVPMNQLRIKDTWFTMGMRATGSNLLIGDDIVVPDHRVLRIGPAVAGRYAADRPDLPRYRSALMPTLATYMIAPYWGMASAALEYVVEHAGKRGVAFTGYERQSDSTAFQLAVAEAATKIDLTRMIAHESADFVDGHAAAGTYPDYVARARIRMHTGHAAELCRAAVDCLVSAHGAWALTEGSPLEARVRDIHTASRHGVANPASCNEIFGRALLGVEPNITEMV